MAATTSTTTLPLLHHHHPRSSPFFLHPSILAPRPTLSHPLRRGRLLRLFSTAGNNSPPPSPSSDTRIQLYRDIETLLTQTVTQTQSAFSGPSNWTEIEGAWVLHPQGLTPPTAVVHFIGGIFVGAAPQLTYRLFLERLSHRANLIVIATPFASGFDHFLIADEAQFKFDRCLRALKDRDRDRDSIGIDSLPSFGIGHSLGSVIHLLIGSRYAIDRSGNVLMAFNNKEASVSIPLFSSVLVPVAQSLGPVISQLASSRTVRMGTEMTLRQLQNLSPPIVKQVLPLVEQLSSLYMDLANGRDNFSPTPEETTRILKSYYGMTRNLLVKFRDDTIDETPRLAQILGVESGVSSMLDLSIRTLDGDHVLPLQQNLPDVPPGVADAVNRGGEILANLAAGTPWESVARDVGSTLGVDSRILGAQNLKDLDNLVDVIASWMALNSNTGSKKLLRP